MTLFSNPKATTSYYKIVDNSTLDGLVAFYPDVPEEGCPYGTGAGVVSTGAQDKGMRFS